ncbi:MAG: copper chaperone PCu(A)C [Magnetovibrionaceae bacterium]
MLRRFTKIAATAAAIAVLAPGSAIADGHGKKIEIEDAFARATPGSSRNGAAFMKLESETADRLLSGSSTVSEAVELHTHINDNGVFRMREVEAIELPAGEDVVLKPGGLHVMLMGLKAPLKEGESFELNLTFEKAGEMTVLVPVRKVGAKMDHKMDHGEHKHH